MRKIYRTLTKDQKERGVIFSSELVSDDTELKKVVHEVKETDSDKLERIEKLKDDKFFNNSPFKHNLIRE
jgi:uncharacterized membrane protein YfhO